MELQALACIDMYFYRAANVEQHNIHTDAIYEQWTQFSFSRVAFSFIYVVSYIHVTIHWFLYVLLYYTLYIIYTLYKHNVWLKCIQFNSKHRHSASSKQSNWKKNLFVWFNDDRFECSNYEQIDSVVFFRKFLAIAGRVWYAKHFTYRLEIYSI